MLLKWYELLIFFAYPENYLFSFYTHSFHTTWTSLLLVLLLILPQVHINQADETYNFGHFITYFCDEPPDDSMPTPATPPTCSITITRNIFTKTILFRAYNAPKIIRCNTCDIGELSGRRALHISIEVMTVDLSDSHVERIEVDGIVGTFKILVLAHNDLASLAGIKLFASTPQLTALDLSHNRITEIGPRAFYGLAALRTLWLSFNLIDHLDDRTFSKLPELKILKLHNNFLKTIEPPLFAANAELNELTLFNNSIESIDDEMVAKLMQIEFFDMPNVWHQMAINRKDDTSGDAAAAADGDELHEMECLMGGLIGYFSELRTVNLSCSSMKQISAEQMQHGFQFKYLNLRRNNLLLLNEPFLFANTAEVTAIDLAHNQIEDIHPEAFSGIEKLEMLWLDHNNISSLPRRVFTNLPNLLILHLRSNHIQSLDTNLFWHNIKLTELSLNDNEISYVGDHVFDQLQQLDVLDVADNVIENEVLISVNAKMVNLSRSGCAYLSVGDRVRILDASSNRISSLNIVAARNLGRLNLADNKIAKIDLSAQRNLRSVDVSDNNLTEMSFTANAYLTAIRLARNYLADVQFSAVPLLERVDLSSNFLRTIQLGSVFNLVDLNLSSNQLTSLMNLTALHSLRFLDVSYNHLSGGIEAHTFQDLDNLQALSLKSCGLPSIPAGLLEHQGNLESLDLSYNGFGLIDVNAVGRLTQLQEFNVNGNDLKALDARAVVRNFPSLERISISDNGWECGVLDGLLSFFRTNYVKVESNIDLEPLVHINGIGCNKAEEDEGRIEDEHVRMTDEGHNALMEGLAKSRGNRVFSIGAFVLLNFCLFFIL